VIQTSGVFLRVQLLRGEINETDYIHAMRGLIQLTREDGRVGAVAEKMDVNRLLLGQPETEADKDAGDESG
jgi:hypothetical protein